ncbi:MULTISPECIES: hypothetical protein [unclassified Pseudoalteromonas]|uniref:hypothetical protein n=1 Tax=unclassified Pseudoalteromonas TaxID=194690 RepID=UPI0013FD9DFF|nr:MULTISPECIES: hypothetical protein [unclassified Pseudoalteromonas]MBG9992135.1 hypothetical protein [Pseudoalteromonas sp. NZS37]
MFEAFNLKLNHDQLGLILTPEHLSKIPEYKSFLKDDLYANSNSHLEKLREHLIESKDVLDGEKIIGDWFPLHHFDIFISHSHKDENLVIILALILKLNCNLNVFIDSLFWGFADDLLKEIDNKYAYDSVTQTYSYETRNKTTSNVFLMLNAALIDVIDKSECLIFFNSENSIYQGGDSSKLYNSESYSTSPWLMSELNFSSKARKVYPERIPLTSRNTQFNESLSKSASDSVDIKYKLPIEHLNSLSQSKFLEWISYICDNELLSHDALDYLYKLTNLGYTNKD